MKLELHWAVTLTKLCLPLKFSIVNYGNDYHEITVFDKMVNWFLLLQFLLLRLCVGFILWIDFRTLPWIPILNTVFTPVTLVNVLPEKNSYTNVSCNVSFTNLCSTTCFSCSKWPLVTFFKTAVLNWHTVDVKMSVDNKQSLYIFYTLWIVVSYVNDDLDSPTLSRQLQT